MNLRVGHLRSSEFFGGPERAILGHCRNMAGPFFCALSFVRRGSENMFLERGRAQDLTVREIPEFGLGDFGVIGRIRRAVLDLRLDVLVTHDYKSVFMALQALRGLPVGHIRHFRGFTWENRKVRAYNWIDLRCMKRMKRIIAVSGRSAEILTEHGIPGHLIKVVPNAIETEKLVPKEFTRKVAEQGPLRAVVAGRLSPEKGQDVLVAALAKLPADAELVVDVYGDGPEEAALAAQVDRLQVDHRINFRGFIPDVLPELKAADLMVLPSRSEGMPNILLEAWSQKSVVISTTVGGVPEMVVDGKDGLLCPSEDPAALADRLSWACQHRDALPALAEAGYEKVQSTYTYAAQSALFETVYGGVVSGR